MKIRLTKILSTALVLGTLGSAALPAAHARSSEHTDTIPQLNATISAHAWIQSHADKDNCGTFKVRAIYKSDNPEFKKPNRIKISWDFYTYGIGASASFSGASINSESSNSAGGHWENTNDATEAWYEGRVCTHGLAWYLGVTATASGYAGKIPFSTTTTI